MTGFANGIVNDRAFALGKLEVEAHWLEDQKDVREQDGRIDPQDLGRRDRDLGGQIGTLAELQKRHLRANGAILGHVTSSLPHQPDRRDLRPFAATGFEKRAVPEWVEYLGLLLRWQRFGHVVLARRNKDSKSNRSHSIHLAAWRRILRKSSRTIA